MGLCFGLEDLNIVGCTNANFVGYVDDKNLLVAMYSYLGEQLFLG
jgi:hypothetical protein